MNLILEMLDSSNAIKPEVAKKVLLGAGVAIAISLLSAMRHYFMPEVSPPLPAIIFQALLMIAAFYVSQTAKEN